MNWLPRFLVLGLVLERHFHRSTSPLLLVTLHHPTFQQVQDYFHYHNTKHVYDLLKDVLYFSFISPRDFR